MRDKTKSPAKDFAGLFYSNLSCESLSSFFRPTVSAINWSVGYGLERKLGNFFSAVGTFPISLNHLARRETLFRFNFFESHEAYPRLFTVLQFQDSQKYSPEMRFVNFFGTLP